MWSYCKEENKGVQVCLVPGVGAKRRFRFKWTKDMHSYAVLMEVVSCPSLPYLCLGCLFSCSVIWQLCEILFRRQVSPLAGIKILVFSFLSMGSSGNCNYLGYGIFMAISLSLKYISYQITDRLLPVPKSGVFPNSVICSHLCKHS